ncbi:hypothetical protein BDZ89DRAFT_581887 [Hymenopellis radicata]|nr:hypothetical protein BDZ89DRAFT_581887 [Hymenopellis radicata]
MFQKIMDRFPDDKLPDHLIPPAANHQPNSNSPRLYIQPPHPTHPIRSGQYLKSVVLAEMESKGIDTIHSKKRKIHENMATDVADKEEFRWRLVPGAALTPFPEVTPGEMFDTRAEDLRETMGPRRGGSSSRGEKRGPPRDFLYDRRDKPPFTRSAHQPSNAGASGSSSPLLRTLSQAPGHERFRSTYQRSPAGQRRHYTSAREMWPNSQTETSLPRSPYMKSESRRAPGALAPVSTEPARPSFNPLATRPAGYGYLEDGLVFFHDKDKVPQKEESSPSKKYVKPSLTAVLKSRPKWAPIGFSRMKREIALNGWKKELDLHRKAGKGQESPKYPRVPPVKVASPSDELHVFGRSEKPPHRDLPPQIPQTTTVDKYYARTAAPDYGRSTEPRRPATSKQESTQWQRALKEMEANLTERKQKLQFGERDAPPNESKSGDVQEDPVTVETITERIGEVSYRAALKLGGI